MVMLSPVIVLLTFPTLLLLLFAVTLLLFVTSPKYFWFPLITWTGAVKAESSATAWDGSVASSVDELDALGTPSVVDGIAVTATGAEMESFFALDFEDLNLKRVRIAMFV
jgi:hypothetical protein